MKKLLIVLNLLFLFSYQVTHKKKRSMRSIAPPFTI